MQEGGMRKVGGRMGMLDNIHEEETQSTANTVGKAMGKSVTREACRGRENVRLEGEMWTWSKNEDRNGKRGRGIYGGEQREMRGM